MTTAGTICLLSYKLNATNSYVLSDIIIADYNIIIAFIYTLCKENLLQA